MSRLAILVLTVCLALGIMDRSVCAQAVPEVGDRIRITKVDGTEIHGILMSISDRGIIIRPPLGQDPPAIPLEEVDRLDRNAGTHTRFLRNFGITLGISVLATTTAVAMTWQPCENWCSSWDEDRASSAIFYGGVLGTAFGVMLGSIVGLAVRYESWEPLSVSGVDSFRVVPLLDPTSSPRMGLSASISTRW